MGSILIGIISFVSISAGLFIGIFLGRTLPVSHLNQSSKDTIMLASGMIATLAALVLGLLVASSKASFDRFDDEYTQAGAKVILLDRSLIQYGPQTKAVRDALRNAVIGEINRIWPEEDIDKSPTSLSETSGNLEPVQLRLNELRPETDLQKELLTESRGLLGDLVQARWLLIEQSETSVPVALYAILLSWLTMLFISIGLFAPSNTTVVTGLILCIASFSLAIFLFDEMASPLDGVIKISSAPMIKALEHLGQS